GSVLATGRPFCCDAKSTNDPVRFDIRDMLTKSQRNFLIQAGEHGWVSGLIVENASANKVFWLGWEYVRALGASIKWDHAWWIEVGPNNRLIELDKIAEVNWLWSSSGRKEAKQHKG